jgi:diphthamide synthase (EF-2-diphthine--ammonia ligase)
MTSKLDHSYLGQELSTELVDRFPLTVSPFGGNGEFHTITTFAPFFKGRLQTSISVTNKEGPYEVCQVRCP